MSVCCECEYLSTCLRLWKFPFYSDNTESWLSVCFPCDFNIMNDQTLLALEPVNWLAAFSTNAKSSRLINVNYVNEMTFLSIIFFLPLIKNLVLWSLRHHLGLVLKHRHALRQTHVPFMFEDVPGLIRRPLVLRRAAFLCITHSHWRWGVRLWWHPCF